MAGAKSALKIPTEAKPLAGEEGQHNRSEECPEDTKATGERKRG
jgi:hypothetical protein